MSESSTGGHPRCLRCKTVELTLLPESEKDSTFYACPQCHRHFSKVPGKDLCDRWLSAVSLLLYRIIFSRSPRERAEDIAKSCFETESPERLDWIIQETTLELEEPTQQVSEILTLVHKPPEAEVREFLRLVVEHLERARGSRP